MSDVVVSTTESVTTVSVVNDIVQIAITESPVTVTTQTAGVQGASYNQGDPIYVTVRNATGATLSKGTIVYTSGGNGTHTQISKALATGDETSARCLGWLAEDITNNASGLCQIEGYLDGINTQGVAEGTQLYLSASTAGAFQTAKPQAPNHLVYVGVCVKTSAGNGRVYVKVQNGYEIDELHNVQIISVANNNVLQYDSTSSLWKNVASTALSVGTASYATTSGTATFATSATSASTAQQAGTALYSLTSGSAYSSTFLSGSILRSQVSDYASGTVASASTAQQAGTAYYSSTSGVAALATTVSSGATFTVSQITDFASGTVANISGTVTQSQVTNLTSDLAGKASLGSANTFTIGAQTIQTGGTANKGLVVRGVASQSANLLEAQTSTGSTALTIGPTGTLGFSGSGSFLSAITGRGIFITNDAASSPLTIRGAASQSANLLEIQDSSAATATRITNVGTIITLSGISTNNSSNTSANSLFVNNSVAGNTVAVIRGAASQSANLLEWQNSAGGTVAYMQTGGNLKASNVATLNSLAQLAQANSGGVFIMARQTAAYSNPGANSAALYFRDGTTAGTLKLVVRAGTAGAETTILDNIPQ